MEKFSYWLLFKSVLIINTFTIGGGLVALPIIKNKFVDDLGWINEDEIYDLFTIAQGAPGIIAINTALLLGKKLAGTKGMFISLFGTILPPFIILFIISYFYNTFITNEIIKNVLFALQACIAALVISISLSMFNGIIKEDKIYNLAVFLTAFILIFMFNINIFYLIIFTIILSIIRYFMKSGDKA